MSDTAPSYQELRIDTHFFDIVYQILKVRCHNYNGVVGDF